MSDRKKFTVSLPADMKDALDDWADTEGRTTANLTTFLLECCIRQAYPERWPMSVKVQFPRSPENT